MTRTMHEVARETAHDVAHHAAHDVAPGTAAHGVTHEVARGGAQHVAQYRTPARVWMTRALAWLLALGCLLGVASLAQARGNAPLESVSLASLPREARNTHALVLAGGPFPYGKDGVTFGNREGALPAQKRGYYREYTVPTPGARNRGARRIVCGGSAAEWSRNRPAACFYTDDHYASFRQIRE